MSLLTVIATVLKRPADLVNQAEDPDQLAERVPQLLLIIVVGAALFGAVVGSYRGGLQLVYAAAKAPALLLIPVGLALPAMRALWAACELEVSWARVGLAGLVATARSAVLAAALGPVLWLAYSVALDYHVAVLVLAASLVVVGAPGFLTLRLAAPAGGRARWLATTGSVALLGLLTMQTGWMLRPFVARPTTEVAFLRPIEEDVFSSLGATLKSAQGDYSESWEVERRGFLSRDIDPYSLEQEVTR